MADPTLCAYCSLPIPGAGDRSPRQPNGPSYCCYGCSLAAQIARDRGESSSIVSPLTRLGVSVFLSMGVMVFSLSLYSREVYGEAATTGSSLAGSWFGLLRYLLLMLATPVFFMLGLPILSNAWRSWKARIISTDALIVIGVAAAFGSSYVATLTGQGHVYYETACMILVLVTLGRYLEAAGKLKASDSVDALATLIPDEVRVRRGDNVETIKSADVCVGDRLIVAPAVRIPVDGIIESGQAHVDERIVTGESRPIPKAPGDPVFAGSIAIDGALTVQATLVGTQSTVGRLATLLHEARRAKGRFERLADSIASVFVPLAVALALLGASLGYHREGIDEAIMTALSVLLISCPCALGIATPMAAWMSLGRAASAGILFRSGEALEALAGIKSVAFDKTGTLTAERTVVSSFVTSADQENELGRILALAAGLEQGSAHGLARGILEYAAGRGVRPDGALPSTTIPGRGLTASVDGADVLIGSPAMMEEASVTFDEHLKSQINGALAAGEPLCCIARGRAALGVFRFSEKLRGEARETVRWLRKKRVHIEVLTGDHNARGASVEKELGVPTQSQLSPSDKITHIQRLRREFGAVAMVGDGINDAPALAAADVGVAMGCGTDLAREAASVCLLGDNLLTLPDAMAIARRTVRTIKLNLFWAFIYNLVGIGLAITGRLNPMFAACAMVASSLFVLTNSLRLGRPTTQLTQQSLADHGLARGPGDNVSSK